MAAKKWKNYEEYLKSEEWKAIKKDFDDNYNTSGWSNVCEVTGETYSKKDLHHHHFRYPKDWNDDSPENIVLICASIHEDIHDEDLPLFSDPRDVDKSTRYKYLSYLRKEYIKNETDHGPYEYEIQELKEKLKQSEENAEYWERIKVRQDVVINSLIDRVEKLQKD